MPRPNTNEHWWTDRDSAPKLIAKNIGGEYVAIAVNVVIGLFMLPFNVAHLGQSTYGLWVLATSLTTYFSVLDLGYGSAQVKFAAQYRARRDAAAINEIASSLFFLFAAIAALAYLVIVVVAFNLHHMFEVPPAQARLGRDTLLIVGIGLAAGFPAGVFGGLVNGFQRYYQNNLISILTSIVTALVNVAVLIAGYGLLALVATTTAVRLGSYLLYWRSARGAFPLLALKWQYVRRERLREVTAFSAFLLLIDIAAKINFTSNTMVIGAVMSTAAIASWMVAQRLTDVIRMLTNALTRSMFPMVVDHATRNRVERLRDLLLEGTRLSLAAVIPLASVTAVLANPLVLAWVGPRFAESVPVVYVLAAVVAVRGSALPAWTMLKGTGHHRMLAMWSLAGAITNLGASIVLARLYGLVGVAIGTLVPMTLINACVLFPTACRHVELSIGRLLRAAFWPTLWPAAISSGLLIWVRDDLGTNVVLIVAAAAAAGLLYAALFLGAAVGAEERQWYFAKLRVVLRPARPVGV
jgi:O-antigen/teichoic acid export membrane protein